ncbi:MAG: hypothetical protein R3315_05035 [Woeseiaceae bacterium]|nr:hypothetical protein [Woeseiaceae bacterium]
MRSDFHIRRPGIETPARQWLAAASMLWVVSLSACGAGADGAEQEIRRWIDAAVLEAEARDRGALMDRVADDYGDARGNDYQRIGGLLAYYFLRQRDVALLTSIDEITVYGDTAAEVRMTVGMAGAANGGGLTADAYRFLLELEKPESDWLLMRAQWGRFGDALR